MKLSSNRLVTTAVALICILGISGCVIVSPDGDLNPLDPRFKSNDCAVIRGQAARGIPMDENRAAAACVTIFPITTIPPPKTSSTVPLRVDSQPSGSIVIVTKDPPRTLVKNQSEADDIASLRNENSYWSSNAIIDHCVTPCVVNIPRGAIFFASAFKKGYASTGYGIALNWYNNAIYGRILNSDNITFRLVPVAPH